MGLFTIRCRTISGEKKVIRTAMQSCFVVHISDLTFCGTVAIRQGTADLNGKPALAVYSIAPVDAIDVTFLASM